MHVYARKAVPLRQIFKHTIMNKREAKRLHRVYEEARNLVKLNKNHEALTLLTKAAQSGYRQAMLSLGCVYYWGKGIEPDTDKAVYWLKRAADMGSHAACLNLAHAYYNLGDTEKYNQLAWTYYFKAAATKDKDLFYLGRMNFEKRGKYESEGQRLNDADAFFQEALYEGCALAGLYLWKLLSEDFPLDAEGYYADGERLLSSPNDYNDWAYTLCEWGEYEKALPYIEECLSMEEQGKEHPNHLDTYAECLYGLGRKQDALRTFGMVMEAYRERDERRRLRETWENMQQKYSDSVSFAISIPQMERIYGLSDE